MRINFEEETHTYTLNGEIAALSVTALLRKHGLAPSYNGIDDALLEQKREHGKRVHKDLENITKLADYLPETKQGTQFAKWLDRNIECATAEQLCGIDYKGLIICGTADFIGFMKDGVKVIADHKNMNSIHKESVMWQVSIYDYFLKKLDGEKINGQLFNWSGATKFLCFQYDNDGEMTIHELEKVADEEIEKLLECEYNNEIYQRPALVVDNEFKLAYEKAELELIELENHYKIVEKNAKEMRAKLLEIMEQQKVKSFETDNIKITYVAPVDRITVDSKKLKAQYPQIYSECQKLSKVSASIRVTIKGGDNEEE